MQTRSILTLCWECWVHTVSPAIRLKAFQISVVDEVSEGKRQCMCILPLLSDV